MNTLLRKLRGVMGIGLMWGILWAAIFAAITIVAWIIDPEVIDDGEGPIRVGAIGGGIGLVSGVGFGIFLSLGESRKAIRDIALSRAARWGILASAVVPLVTGRRDQVFVMCPIGAALAMAAVAIAGKAEVRDMNRPKRVLDAISGYVLASVRDAVNPTKEPSET